jgi:hypothetical protein
MDIATCILEEQACLSTVAEHLAADPTIFTGLMFSRNLQMVIATGSTERQRRIVSFGTADRNDILGWKTHEDKEGPGQRLKSLGLFFSCLKNSGIDTRKARFGNDFLSVLFCVSKNGFNNSSQQIARLSHMDIQISLIG